MNSQFGLMNVWAQGDWVTKAVALILLLMSLASWMVIIIKALDIMKYKRLASEVDAFWKVQILQKVSPTCQLVRIIHCGNSRNRGLKPHRMLKVIQTRNCTTVLM